MLYTIVMMNIQPNRLVRLPQKVELPSTNQKEQKPRPMIALCGLCGLRVDPTNCPTCGKPEVASR